MRERVLRILDAANVASGRHLAGQSGEIIRARGTGSGRGRAHDRAHLGKQRGEDPTDVLVRHRSEDQRRRGPLGVVQVLGERSSSRRVMGGVQ